MERLIDLDLIRQDLESTRRCIAKCRDTVIPQLAQVKPAKPSRTTLRNQVNGDGVHVALPAAMTQRQQQ